MWKKSLPASKQVTTGVLRSTTLTADQSSTTTLLRRGALGGIKTRKPGRKLGKTRIPAQNFGKTRKPADNNQKP